MQLNGRDVKKELTRLGVPFDEISLFTDCLLGIKNQGYDVKEWLQIIRTNLL